MSRHTALIRWARGDAVFTDNAYSRGHTWTFDGGLTVPASASPAIQATGRLSGAGSPAQ